MLAVGGINRGAGCIVELDALGNEIGGTVDSGALELAKGELGKGEFVLDENPLDGELLNMSKPFDVFPGLLGLAELLAAIGDGPETSGMVWSRLIKSANSGFSGVSVPFMAM